MAARQDDLYPVAYLAHLKNDGLDPLADVVCLPGNLLTPRKNGFRLADRYRGHAAFKALNRAVDQVALEGRVFIENGVALGFANLLNHHLLGTLSGNSAKQAGVDDLLTLACLDNAGVPVDG